MHLFVEVCPSGRRWFDVAQSTVSGHRNAECSGIGDCNRISGKCLCPQGYEGKACNFRKCLNDCSGHGRCLDMQQYAAEGAAFPLRNTLTFQYLDDGETNTWDAKMNRGCLCDSSWSVGLDSGETQLAEYFGPDCSLRRCPSADDPWTTVDETDCNKKYDNGASDAPLIEVAVTQSVASSATETTLTHVAGARALVAGDTVTVSGHSGSDANLAMNQIFTVKTVTSSTVLVLTGTGMTAGTYVPEQQTVSANTAASATETTITHVAFSRSLVVGESVTVSGHTGDAANLAMNQVYVVKTVTDSTHAILTGTGMTAGTYNTGAIIVKAGLAAKFSMSSYGNKCLVECANRGLCDYENGKCKCFLGWHGAACTTQVTHQSKLGSAVND
jgi:hypothetical protein